jgi:hypothetical protein
VKKQKTPTRSSFSVLRQICNLIPTFLTPKLAAEHGVDKKARTYTPWSHVVTMLFAQLAHSIGLNDVCDALRMCSGPLSALRGAKAPSRNALSHANKHRDSKMAENLFWSVLEHLQTLSPGFGTHRRGKRFAFRFKRVVHLVDSTTIQLIAHCMDWAKHRRRKAAAKCHLRLDLQSFLPRFAIIDTARQSDSRRAREACAGIQAGEIVIFDRAYVDYEHLFDLWERGVFWVTRAKEGMSYRVTEKRLKKAEGKILKDELILLNQESSLKKFPDVMRRIVALVEVDGVEREMVFLANNLEWSPQSVVDLYRCRWQIEVFFKEIKQTLKLADFLGHSANAVRWQVWTALLVYVLLRYLAFLSQWGHSFTRLFTVVRAVLWRKVDIAELLRSYGTAGGSYRMLAQPQLAYLPGFERTGGTAGSTF